MSSTGSGPPDVPNLNDYAGTEFVSNESIDGFVPQLALTKSISWVPSLCGVMVSTPRWARFKQFLGTEFVSSDTLGPWMTPV